MRKIQSGRPILLTSIGIALLLGSILLGLAVHSGYTRTWDEELMRQHRSFTLSLAPNYNDRIHNAVRDISSLGSMTVIGMVSVFTSLYFLIKKRYSATTFVLTSWLGGVGLMNGLKLLYARGRPDVVEKLGHATGYSFPSGHTMVATVVYTSVALLLLEHLPVKAQRIYVTLLSVFLTLAIGWSRVYLGVHYPSDVLGGWGFGLLFVLLIWTGKRYLEPSNKNRQS